MRDTTQTLDLYLSLDARSNRINPPPSLDKSAKINVAEIIFTAEINAPYSQVIREKRFPKGSVIDYLLNSREKITLTNSESVPEVGEIWPFLKTISVHYGEYWDRWGELSQYGFWVDVEFAASLTEEIGSKTIGYFVPSGLDPIKDWSEQPKKTDKFKPRDILITQSNLAFIIYGLGIERWKGDAKTVEANKRKYLKKP